MKTRFFIEVDVDTDQRGIEYVELHKGEAKELCEVTTGCYPRGPNNFRVYLRGDVDFLTGPNVEVSAVAHELGHVLAAQFKLPCDLKDPRLRLEMKKYKNKKNALKIMAAEKEAWDVAEMMFSIRSVRRQALATYQKYLNVK